MDERLNLSDELHEICEHVYNQPSASLTLQYPCVVYKLAQISPRHADNRVYLTNRQYTLTVIDRDPDSELREKVANLPFCRMTRTFENDNLHHWVFNIYTRRRINHGET